MDLPPRDSFFGQLFLATIFAALVVYILKAVIDAVYLRAMHGVVKQAGLIVEGVDQELREERARTRQNRRALEDLFPPVPIVRVTTRSKTGPSKTN